MIFIFYYFLKLRGFDFDKTVNCNFNNRIFLTVLGVLLERDREKERKRERVRD